MPNSASRGCFCLNHQACGKEVCKNNQRKKPKMVANLILPPLPCLALVSRTICQQQSGLASHVLQCGLPGQPHSPRGGSEPKTSQSQGCEVGHTAQSNPGWRQWHRLLSGPPPTIKKGWDTPSSTHSPDTHLILNPVRGF